MNNQNSLSYQVSNADLKRKIHHNFQLIEYPQLSQYNDIRQLLPNAFSIAVLLVETQPQGGHWVCLIRRNNMITFFDSYGLKYDNELKFVDNAMRKQLHENPYLTPLLNKAKKDGFGVTYNKKRLQQFGNGINTCGKFVISVCNAFCDGLDLSQYLQLLDEQKNMTKLSYDQIVNELYQAF